MSKKSGPTKSRLEDDLFDPAAVERDVFEGFPTRNELVIATVMEVANHGCYVRLDEYDNLKAYIHISELSRTWVKNIRVHVREGQRIVAKVLRVDPRKSQIDLSIKRVPEQMRKLKLLEAKQNQTANTLFRLIIDQVPPEERKKADEVWRILVENFELLYYGLEFASTASQKKLVELGISPAWAKVIRKVAAANIVPATVEIKGTMEISIPCGDGVLHLKEALLTGKKAAEKNTQINIYTKGSPRYAIEVTAEDYKVAEKALENALNRVQEIVESHNGTFKFTRKK